MNSLPSTQGYRYLWPAVMVLFVSLPWRDTVRFLGIALLAGIAALWSFETLIFSLGPLGALACLEAVRSRSVARGWRMLLPALLGALGAHLALAVYVLAAHGRVVDYVPYLQLLSHFGPQGNNVNSWNVLVPRYFGLWLVFAFAFFVPLAVAAREALGGHRTSELAWRLVPVAVLGVAQASYFLGRSTYTTLGLALMPFLVIVILYSESYALELWRNGGWRRWPERVLLALALAFLFAFPLERFSHPYRPESATATILRRCLSESGCLPSEVYERVSRQARTTASSMTDDDFRYAAGPRAGELKERLSELVGMISDYYPAAGARVPLIVDERTLPFVSVLALADTGTWYFWPVASPMNDFMSEKLADGVMASAALLEDDDHLLVERNREGLYEPLQKLLARIEARCKLRPEREGTYFRVLALEGCQDGG